MRHDSRSQTDEEEVKRLGPLAKRAGVDLLEAPLTGGVHLVRSGDMTVLVGGEGHVLQRHLALLNDVGGKVIHCGGWGSGSVVKIISNMLAAVHLVAGGEALMLGEWTRLTQTGRRASQASSGCAAAMTASASLSHAPPSRCQSRRQPRKA